MNGWKRAICGVLLCATGATADDLVLSPSQGVVQRTVYYAAPAVAAPVPTTTYYAPTAPQPVTTYYAPAPAPVMAPAAVVPAPVPVTAYYAPVVAPRPVVTYYGPAAVPVTTYYAGPAAVPVTTYYAPAAAVPVVVAPAGVVRSKVYYPGEPVRNFFKALAP